MPTSPENEPDGEPIEREGRETLLPSVTRSVLSIVRESQRSSVRAGTGVSDTS